MTEILSKLNPGELITLVAVAGGVLIALACVLKDGFCKTRRLAFKQDMINRGMSAEEVRMVIEAGSKESLKESRRASQTSA
jgi:hypothetical protein